jgi:ribose/xylose/arabinose/galactoside ABC-type transport system permease subunit
MVSLLIGLLIIGVVLYLLQLIPMDDAIRKIIRVVLIVIAVLWLLSALFGISTPGLRLNG